MINSIIAYRSHCIDIEQASLVYVAGSKESAGGHGEVKNIVKEFEIGEIVGAIIKMLDFGPLLI